MVKMGDVWDRAIEFISDNIAVILPIALLAIFVPTCLSENFQALQKGGTPGLAIGLGLGIAVLALVSLWGQLVLTALAIAPDSANAARGAATRRFLPVIGISLLLGIAITLLLIPAVVIVVASGIDMTAVAAGIIPDVPQGARWALAIYGLLVLPLLIWLGARLIILSPVIIAERLGIGAIARSFHLTRESALRIIGVMILFGIVVFVASMAARTVFGSLLALLIGGEGALTLASVLTSIIAALVSTGFTVIQSAFVAKLYRALAPAQEAAADVA